MLKISAVMPVYNGEAHLNEAIDSILAQTFGGFEFIIIDDGSTDRTAEIINAYNDDRIVYIRNAENLGVARSLNRGIEAARGEYIARMDADDISEPRRFETQLRFMESHKRVGVCGSAMTSFYGSTPYKTHVYQYHHGHLVMELIYDSPLAHPTVMLRRSVLIKNNLRYDPAYEKAEDYRLWLTMAGHCRLCSLPDLLLRYRIHDPGEDRRPFKEEQARSVQKIREDMYNSFSPNADPVEFSLYMRLCGYKLAFNEEEYAVILLLLKKILSHKLFKGIRTRLCVFRLHMAIASASGLQLNSLDFIDTCMHILRIAYRRVVRLVGKRG
jgi:glycosyltransferase involved in cell wall biosynthesis